jgi:ABC-type transport system involved in Fe-S cluster assembly fused permease/ATPase subunit
VGVISLLVLVFTVFGSVCIVSFMCIYSYCFFYISIRNTANERKINCNNNNNNNNNNMLLQPPKNGSALNQRHTRSNSPSVAV